MAHVLITGVIVAVLAASLLRMTLLNYVVTQRAAGGAQERKEAEGAFNRLMTRWNSTNLVCDDLAGVYNCSGTPGTCACTCTPFDAQNPTVTAAVTGGLCTVNVTTVDGP
jgi:hypothetical protein